MLAGMRHVARLLVGARESKFSRGVQWIEFDGVLESFDRLRILPGLRIGAAQKVPGVGIVGIDLSDAAEGVYRGLRIARVFIKQAEVIPGMRVGGITFDRFFEKFLGL